MAAYISISCLPLPTFVEGGRVTFEPGEQHPNRDDLEYFVLMFLTQGTLYIAEDDTQYTVHAGEMFILQPKHHHYSWQPMQEETEYYWLHFFVSGEWVQRARPTMLTSAIAVPTLHHYTPTLTLYLPKQASVKKQLPNILPTAQRLFAASQLRPEFGFWQTQQLFIDVLQNIQAQSQEETKLIRLAEGVLRFLQDHYAEKITNSRLAAQFHFHPNYIVRALKQAVGLTPNAFLTQYRMEEAQRRLLNTDDSVAEIAEAIGYQNIYYFSTAFKKHTGLSPQKYRESRTTVPD